VHYSFLGNYCVRDEARSCSTNVCNTKLVVHSNCGAVAVWLKLLLGQDYISDSRRPTRSHREQTLVENREVETCHDMRLKSKDIVNIEH
jgi:hypothetical protein